MSIHFSSKPGSPDRTLHPHSMHPFQVFIAGESGSEKLYVNYGILFMPFVPNDNWFTRVIPELDGTELVNPFTDTIPTAWPNIDAAVGVVCVRLKKSGYQYEEATILIKDADDVVDSALYTYIELASITEDVTNGGYLIEQHVRENLYYHPVWRWPFECIPYTNGDGDKGVLIQYGIIYDSRTGASDVPTIDIGGVDTALVTDILSNNLVTSNSTLHYIYLVAEVDDSDEWEPVYDDFRIESQATSVPSDTSTLKHFLLATYDPTTDVVVQSRTGNFVIDRDGQSGAPYYLSKAP